MARQHVEEAAGGEPEQEPTRTNTLLDVIGWGQRLIRKNGLIAGLLVFLVLLFFVLSAVRQPGGDAVPSAPSRPDDPATAEVEVVAEPAAPEATAGDITATDATDITAEPTATELAAQDPIALTEGTWRFFAHTDESIALFDFGFSADGSVYEDGAEDRTFGTYAVDGNTVTLTLTRHEELSASTPGKGERSDDVSWTEWFTMTRVGNTMTGAWTGESWRYSYEAGFVLSGEIVDRNQAGQVVFARPQRASDAG